jgi:predicted RNA-binding Zn-ribbon protein involved in translation (DUF1610 family)
MARRHRRTSIIEPLAYPQYEWAFDATGTPIPISRAMRGETYYCPLCGGKMIARLGGVKQHHFAHEEFQDCPPAEVAQAAAGRWLSFALRGDITARRQINLSWTCPLCRQTHTADLLSGITQVEQNHAHHGIQSDIALLDAAGKVRAALLFTMPDKETQMIYNREAIALIVIDPKELARRIQDVPTLLKGATILSGVCTVQQNAARHGVVTDVKGLRDRLTDTANRPPYRFYGPLQTVDGLTHVFVLGDQKLWLPPILWQRAIGGLKNTISPTLQVVSQEWPQIDGGVIALFYITSKDSHAIAVRRFAPDQPVYARLNNSLFRTPRANATDIARSFAEG